MKLHKNVSNHYRANLFNKIAVNFNHAVQTTQESPAPRLDHLLVLVGE